MFSDLSHRNVGTKRRSPPGRELTAEQVSEAEEGAKLLENSSCGFAPPKEKIL